MYRLNPDCWVWSPAPPTSVFPSHSGTLNVPVQLEGDVEEGETGELHPVCHHPTGCQDIISPVSDVQWSSYEPPAHSVISSTLTLTECDPNAYSSEHEIMLIETNRGEMLQPFVGACSWDDPRTEAHRCVGGCESRELEDVGSCWAGSPFIYHAVTANMVVEVDVVEEVAVEDTLEVITEDVYTDALLDLEDLQNQQLYPP